MEVTPMEMKERTYRALMDMIEALRVDCNSAPDCPEWVPSSVAADLKRWARDIVALSSAPVGVSRHLPRA